MYRTKVYDKGSVFDLFFLGFKNWRFYVPKKEANNAFLFGISLPNNANV